MCQENAISQPSDYFNERLEDQRQWHERKANWNKRRFYFVEIAIIVLGALIPVINILPLPDGFTRIASGSLSSLIVILAGIGKLYNFHENWLDFRATEEALKREKEFYLHVAGDYAEAEAAQRARMLVDRVESILAATTTRFFAVQRERKEPTTGGESKES